MEEDEETSDDSSDHHGDLDIAYWGTKVMLDQNIHNQAEQFIKEIRETDVYKTYEIQLARLKQNPELYEQVNNYRKLNFEMQSATQVDDLFDKMDYFEKEYKQFRENVIVDDFLKAELALCRMMQEIDALIVDGLDFQ